MTKKLLKQQTAIVIGATGLVGSSLIDLLIEDETFSSILVFSRRAIQQKHPKIEEHLVDFNEIEKWSNYIQGDVLFSALGTTLKTVGTKQAQYTIDFTYQYEVAKRAALNGVHTYVLVSSQGANPNSIFFYPKMKGELESAIKPLPFYKTIIAQPSFLDGKRNQKRWGEQKALAFFRWVSNHLPLPSLTPIHARVLANAMVNGFKAQSEGVSIFNNVQLLKLGKK